MKGIVLAGGKGSRLRPFTYSGAKQLVPIGNTPVLHFPVRQLVEAGIAEIAIVVGDTETQIREAMGDGSAFGARFTYIQQPAPLGLAHAVSICRSFVGSEPFILYLGDNVLQGGIRPFVSEFSASQAEAAVLLKSVADPRSFGVARFAGEHLAGVVEKPLHPPTDLAVIGIYAFRQSVFDVIAGQSPSARGELEIADSINGLLAAGWEVTAARTTRYWIDTGKMEDMLAANREVLSEIEAVVDPSARLVGSALEGRISVGPGAVIEDCRVVGPVAIAAGARLSRCTIGPDAAIGANCLFRQVNIHDSIVMERTEMRACPGIEASMIGRFAYVSGAPAGARLTLGDHSRFEADQ